MSAVEGIRKRERAEELAERIVKSEGKKTLTPEDQLLVCEVLLERCKFVRSLVSK